MTKKFNLTFLFLLVIFGIAALSLIVYTFFRTGEISTPNPVNTASQVYKQNTTMATLQPNISHPHYPRSEFTKIRVPLTNIPKSQNLTPPLKSAKNKTTTPLPVAKTNSNKTTQYFPWREKGEPLTPFKSSDFKNKTSAFTYFNSFLTPTPQHPVKNNSGRSNYTVTTTVTQSLAPNPTHNPPAQNQTEIKLLTESIPIPDYLQEQNQLQLTRTEVNTSSLTTEQNEIDTNKTKKNKTNKNKTEAQSKTPIIKQSVANKTKTPKTPLKEKKAKGNTKTPKTPLKEKKAKGNTESGGKNPQHKRTSIHNHPNIPGKGGNHSTLHKRNFTSMHFKPTSFFFYIGLPRLIGGPGIYKRVNSEKNQDAPGDLPDKPDDPNLQEYPLAPESPLSKEEEGSNKGSLEVQVNNLCSPPKRVLNPPNAPVHPIPPRSSLTLVALNIDFIVPATGFPLEEIAEIAIQTDPVIDSSESKSWNQAVSGSAKNPRKFQRTSRGGKTALVDKIGGEGSLIYPLSKNKDRKYSAEVQGNREYNEKTENNHTPSNPRPLITPIYNLPYPYTPPISQVRFSPRYNYFWETHQSAIKRGGKLFINSSTKPY
jgi:hypothetical protein